MCVFRVREYLTSEQNRNVAPVKMELTTEHRAANFAPMDEHWIYFFAELGPID